MSTTTSYASAASGRNNHNHNNNNNNTARHHPATSPVLAATTSNSTTTNSNHASPLTVPSSSSSSSSSSSPSILLQCLLENEQGFRRFPVPRGDIGSLSKLQQMLCNLYALQSVNPSLLSISIDATDPSTGASGIIPLTSDRDVKVNFGTRSSATLYISSHRQPQQHTVAAYVVWDRTMLSVFNNSTKAMSDELSMHITQSCTLNRLIAPPHIIVLYSPSSPPPQHVHSELPSALFRFQELEPSAYTDKGLQLTDNDAKKLFGPLSDAIICIHRNTLALPDTVRNSTRLYLLHSPATHGSITSKSAGWASAQVYGDHTNANTAPAAMFGSMVAPMDFAGAASRTNSSGDPNSNANQSSESAAQAAQLLQQLQLSSVFPDSKMSGNGLLPNAYADAFAADQMDPSQFGWPSGEAPSAYGSMSGMKMGMPAYGNLAAAANAFAQAQNQTGSASSPAIGGATSSASTINHSMPSNSDYMNNMNVGDSGQNNAPLYNEAQQAALQSSMSNAFSQASADALYNTVSSQQQSQQSPQSYGNMGNAGMDSSAMFFMRQEQVPANEAQQMYGAPALYGQQSQFMNPSSSPLQQSDSQGQAQTHDGSLAGATLQDLGQAQSPAYPNLSQQQQHHHQQLSSFAHGSNSSGGLDPQNMHNAGMMQQQMGSQGNGYESLLYSGYNMGMNNGMHYNPKDPMAAMHGDPRQAAMGGMLGQQMSGYGLEQGHQHSGYVVPPRQVNEVREELSMQDTSTTVINRVFLDWEHLRVPHKYVPAFLLGLIRVGRSLTDSNAVVVTAMFDTSRDMHSKRDARVLKDCGAIVKHITANQRHNNSVGLVAQMRDDVKDGDSMVFVSGDQDFTPYLVSLARDEHPVAVVYNEEAPASLRDNSHWTARHKYLDLEEVIELRGKIEDRYRRRHNHKRKTVPCWDYNAAQGCSRGVFCDFKHVCRKCGGGHPAFDCVVTAGPALFCALCSLRFQNETEQREHLLGEQHAQRAFELKQMSDSHDDDGDLAEAKALLPGLDDANDPDGSGAAPASGNVPLGSAANLTASANAAWNASQITDLKTLMGHVADIHLWQQLLHHNPKRLLALRGDHGETVLHCASQHSAQAVRVVLSDAASSDRSSLCTTGDNDGCLPLHWAVMDPEKASNDTVRMLLSVAPETATMESKASASHGKNTPLDLAKACGVSADIIDSLSSPPEQLSRDEADAVFAPLGAARSSMVRSTSSSAKAATSADGDSDAASSSPSTPHLASLASPESGTAKAPQSISAAVLYVLGELAEEQSPPTAKCIHRRLTKRMHSDWQHLAASKLSLQEVETQLSRLESNNLVAFDVQTCVWWRRSQRGKLLSYFFWDSERVRPHHFTTEEWQTFEEFSRTHCRFRYRNRGEVAAELMRVEKFQREPYAKMICMVQAARTRQLVRFEQDGRSLTVIPPRELHGGSSPNMAPQAAPSAADHKQSHVALRKTKPCKFGVSCRYAQTPNMCRFYHTQKDARCLKCEHIGHSSENCMYT
jgi:NYN domain